MVKTKSQFKNRSIANNVEIIIPVPSDVDSPSFKASIGNVTYVIYTNDDIRGLERLYLYWTALL